MAEQTAEHAAGNVDPIVYKDFDKNREFKIGPPVLGWSLKTATLSDEAKEQFRKEINEAFSGFDIGAGIIFDSNPRSGFWVHDEFTKEEAYGEFKKSQGFPNFKNKPTHYATWNEPQNPHVMQTLSFAEFKELETYPDRCQVYAHKSLRAIIVMEAYAHGYTLSAEVPRSEEASILEFSKTGEDETVNLDKLWSMYLGSLYGDAKPLSFSKPAQSLVIEFAKLVRVLTIAETKESVAAHIEDGHGNIVHSPQYFARMHTETKIDETIIKLPKDFTL